MIEDEDLAAEHTRDFYTIMFSYHLTDALVMWGFWDARHWKKSAPLYRADWSEKPALKEYRRLIEQEWASNEDGKTSAAGKYDTRAFLGTYEISVKAGDKTKTVKLNLEKGRNKPVVVKL